MQQGFLYRFFHALRNELEIELGIGEYFLLLEAIDLGYDPGDTEAMYELCQRLWLKSIDQEEVFRQLFVLLAKEEIELAAKKLAEEQHQRSMINDQSSTLKDQLDSDSGKDQHIRNQDNQAQNPKQATKNDQLKTLQQEPSYTSVEVAIEFSEPVQQEIEEADFFKRKYLLASNYQPLTLREMKQNWRFLRNKIESGTSDELDIVSTVRQVAKTGLLEKLHHLPSYENKLQQFLFIDLSRSMVAFHDLGKQLERAAREGGGKHSTHIYFFEKTLKAPFYTNRERTKSESMEAVFKKMPPLYSNVLIFSDAGAASGSMDAERMSAGWYFLLQLKQKAQHTAWLNPLQARRWQGTAAATLAQISPMFPFDKSGFAEMIKTLRGKKEKQ